MRFFTTNNKKAKISTILYIRFLTNHKRKDLMEEGETGRGNGKGINK